jgi:Holliday junction resolvase
VPRGLDGERRLRTAFNEDGWVAIRAAKGAVDLVLARPGELRFVQVKRTIRPYDHFGPEDRQILKGLAQKAGATAWLIWWPPRKGWRWVPVSEWPGEKQTPGSRSRV